MAALVQRAVANASTSAELARQALAVAEARSARAEEAMEGQRAMARDAQEKLAAAQEQYAELQQSRRSDRSVSRRSSTDRSRSSMGGEDMSFTFLEACSNGDIETAQESRHTKLRSTSLFFFKKVF